MDGLWIFVFFGIAMLVLYVILNRKMFMERFSIGAHRTPRKTGIPADLRREFWQEVKNQLRLNEIDKFRDLTPEQVSNLPMRDVFGQVSLMVEANNRSRENARRKNTSNDDLYEMAQQLNLRVMFTLSRNGHYGFITPEGKMFLDQTRMYANTKIREYGHLWIEMMRRGNKPQYDELMDVISKSGLFRIMLNRSAPAKIPPKVVCEDALSWAIAKNGDGVFSDKISTDKLKAMLLEFWSWLIDKMHINASPYDVGNLTLSEFLDNGGVLEFFEGGQTEDDSDIEEVFEKETKEEESFEMEEEHNDDGSDMDFFGAVSSEMKDRAYVEAHWEDVDNVLKLGKEYFDAGKTKAPEEYEFAKKMFLQYAEAANRLVNSVGPFGGNMETKAPDMYRVLKEHIKGIERFLSISLPKGKYLRGAGWK